MLLWWKQKYCSYICHSYCISIDIIAFIKWSIFKMIAGNSWIIIHQSSYVISKKFSQTKSMKCSHFLLGYTMGFIKRNIFSSHTYLSWQRNVIEAFVKIIICWIMICDVNVSYVTPITALIWCTDILQKVLISFIQM